MFTRHLWLPATCLAVLFVLLPGGCVITVDPFDGNADGGGNGSGTDQITIRIVNTTNTGLDPEIYISDQPVNRDSLFVSANKFTDFGVLGLGAIEAFGSDSFTIDCAAARVIGTTGGSFGDKVTEPEGTGTERILAQDAQFNCGDRITFTYKREAGGFSTSVAVD